MLTGFKGSQTLRREIQLWLDEKIISEEQAKQLAEKYELDKDAPWYYQSNFILGGVATILVLMGFVLIISYNWDILPNWARMLSGLLPLFVSYGFCLYFLNQLKRDAAELAMFAGSVLFGINIFLQAQIFNLSSYYPDGFLWWLIGALPAAVYWRSHLLGVILQLVYLAWLALQIQNAQFSLLSPVFMVAFLFLLYKKTSWPAVILHLFLIFYFLGNISLYLEMNAYKGWWYGSVYRMYSIPFLSAYGVLFLALFSKVAPQYSEKFRSRIFNLLEFFIILFFFLYTFEETLTAGNFMFSPFIFYGLALLLILPDWKKISPGLKFSFGIVLLLLIVKLVLSLEPPTEQSAEIPLTGDNFRVFFKVVMNIFFFAFCVGSICLGIRIRDKRQFMSGVFWLLVLALGRYLDLFNDYLTSAVIFILSGLVIYFVNYLWNTKYATR